MVRASLKTIPPKGSRKFATHDTLLTCSTEPNKTMENSLSILSRELLQTDAIDVKTSYNKLQNKITCQRDQKRTQHKYNLSSSTLQLIKDRKSLFDHKIRKQNIKKITDLSKKIKESIKKDRKVKKLLALEKHIARTGGTRKALKELRESN